MSDPAAPTAPAAAQGFDAGWLAQREPFDIAARDPGLARAFAAALPRGPGEPVRLVDLAAGSGANFRALAPLIGGDQDWLLIDHDPLLLAAQPAHIAAWAAQHGWRCEAQGEALWVHAGSARWRVRGQAMDLARSLPTLDLLAAHHGIVTTAFLDLVSAAWLDDFSRLVAQARRPLLATLTVNGPRDWLPASTHDAPVHAAFVQHQLGDKGFGPALGPHAVAHLVQRLQAAGATLHPAPSDWHIDATHPAMLQRLLDDTAAVARQAGAADATAPWHAERSQQLRAGRLQLSVGHVDVLALPGPPTSP